MSFGNVKNKTVVNGHEETQGKYINSPSFCENVTVWCGVSRFGIFGPYFFENQNSQMVTVNKEGCIELIQNFLVPSIQQLGLEINFFRFQQDGATVHTSDVSMAILQRLFPGHLISQFGDVA